MFQVQVHSVQVAQSHTESIVSGKKLDVALYHSDAVTSEVLLRSR